ncbi:MAG: hypothetical protein RMI01_10690, partial [Thermodesulfovibrio sp.]|nr:hypothetical protein [Thermodesulfovibrio sp.]
MCPKAAYKRFENMPEKKYLSAEIFMTMHGLKKLGERAKEKTILEIKNRKKDSNCKIGYEEVWQIFKDKLCEEFSYILPPEFVAADYKLSVFSTIELNGEHYLIKYNIPSLYAFIPF